MWNKVLGGFFLSYALQVFQKDLNRKGKCANIVSFCLWRYKEKCILEEKYKAEWDSMVFILNMQECTFISLSSGEWQL